MAGVNVNTLGRQLASLGPEGYRAFQEMTRAIRSADRSMFSLQGSTKKLINTFFNTVRYQASASAINLISSSIKDAIDYAKDLDKSLTNIRVVTGKSADTMAAFAKEANKSAKALATSTKSYADASLIYFQQGLSDTEVKVRTDTTIKLANAVGQSSEEVSNWMTAIWNNFDDGSQSLEYYADVLAKLGAETASSADEIAAGLEKFAAVGDTIGLSYEYAASALATITAETRQSADVVGTALKTIFSRMEGLKLGENLDDGTTLNQYSAALMAVGVNIKDAGGELKDMDTILDETANKWQRLGKEQQIALAQSVAGIRQYTQFIALMDNWDVMQKNIESTKEASGSLEEMQAIYEDSVEGAQNKARVAAEALKQSLITGDEMKGFYEGLAKITDFATKLVEAFGGLPGILSLIATKIGALYQPQVAEFLRTSLMNATSLINKKLHRPTTADKTASTLLAQSYIFESTDSGGGAAADATQQIAEIEAQYLANSQKMTESKKHQLEMELELLSTMKQKIALSNAEKEDAEKDRLEASDRAEEAKRKVLRQQQQRPMLERGIEIASLDIKRGGAKSDPEADLRNCINELKELKLELADGNAEGFIQELQGVINSSEQVETKAAQAYTTLQKLKESIKQTLQNQGSGAQALLEINPSELQSAGESIGKVNASVNRVQSIIGGSSVNQFDQTGRAQVAETMKKSVQTMKDEMKQLQVATDNIKFDEIDKAFDKWVKEGTLDLKKLKAELQKIQAAMKEKQGSLVPQLDPNATGAVVEYRESLVDTLDESVKYGETMQRTSDASDDFANSARTVGDNVNAAATSTAHWTDRLTSGLSGLSQFGSGLLMLGSAVSNISEKVASGTDTWEDWFSTVITGFPTIMQLLSGITTLTNAFAVANKNSGKAAKKGAAETIAANGAIQASEGSKGATGVAAKIALGDLIGAALGIAALAAVGITIGVNIAKGRKQSQEQQRQKTIETSQAQVENISKNQEMSQEVGNLIDDYKEFLAVGKDTSALYDELNKKIPELISGYKALGDSLEGVAQQDLRNVSQQLEDAYRLAQLTGDYTEFNRLKGEADDIAMAAQADAAKSGATAATESLGVALADQYGSVDRATNTYKMQVKPEEGSKSTNVLENVMGDYYVSRDEDELEVEDTLQVNLSDPSAVIEFYEKLQTARVELEKTMPKDALENDSTYQVIKEQLLKTSDAYLKAKESVDEYNQVAAQGIEIRVKATHGEAASLTTMDEYLDYQNEYIRVAKEIYGLDEAKAKQLLLQSRSAGRVGEEYELATLMAKKFYDVTDEQLSEESAQEYFKAVSEGFKELSDQELSVAVGVALNTNSVEEFNEELPHALIDAAEVAAAGIKDTINGIISSSVGDQKLSSANLAYLQSSEEFKTYLETLNLTFHDFTNQAYSEQIVMLQNFSQQQQAVMYGLVEDQKALYLEQLAEKEDQLNNILAMEEKYGKSMLDGYRQAYADFMKQAEDITLSSAARENAKNEAARVAKEFNDKFEIDITVNTSNVRAAIAEIEDKIAEIDEQTIKIAIEWDGIDEIDQLMTNNSKFAKAVESDMKKVGNSYQMTAAQVRKWGEIYPELFAQAEHAADGLLSLNAKLVDDFIASQEAEADSVIDNKIQSLEAERIMIEEKLALRKKDAEVAAMMAQGELKLDQLSAESLILIREKMTQYLIDLGVDEEEANTLALEAMGTNQQEYTKLVADSAVANTTNMTRANKAIDANTSEAVKNMSFSWKNLGLNVLQVGSIISKILSGGVLTPEDLNFRSVFESVDAEVELDTVEVKLDNYEFIDSEGKTINREDIVNNALKDLAPTIDLTISAQIDELEKALDSIDTQILYLEGLKNQDFSDFGETDIDKVKDEDKNKNTAEELKEIAERYHEIEREIAALERTSKRYNKQAARAWGPEKLKYMKWQLATLKETEKKQRDLLKAQTVFLVSDQATVQSQFNNKAVFNANGDIANYTALLQQATDAYNAAVKTGDEEAIKAAKKVYDKQVEALEQYEKTLDAVEKQKDAIIELNTEMASMATEVIEYELKYKIEVSEFSISNLEFQIGKLSDAIGDAAERFYLMGLSMDESAKKAEAAEKSIVDTLGTAGLTMDDILGASDSELEALLQDKHLSEEQITALKNGFSEMASATTEVQTKFAELGEAIVTEFQNANKEFDTLTQNMQHSSSIIDSYRNIIDLAGQHTLGISDDTLLKMSETQFKLAENSVKVAKEQLEMNKANLAVVEAQLKAAIALAEAEGRSVEDDPAVQMLQKTYDELFTVVQEKEQALLTAMENALEARQKLFKEELDQAMKTFEKSMSGQYGSFKGMQEAYNQQKALSKLFVADYEKIYSLSKLTRDIQNSIDDTDSIKGKERLLEIQEEINEAQKDGVQMTQYELDELRAKYDLRLAEIALEEAQNAKSVVRMQRNATGNWGYVYTADTNEVDAVMQAYEDKMYAYQKKMQDYTDQLQDQLIQIPQDYAAAIRAIYEDQTLSDEERRLRIKETQEYYSKMYSHVVNQLGIVNEDASRFYQEDWTNYAATSGYKISENQRWVDSFEETLVAKISGGFTTLEGLEENFKRNSEILLGQTQSIYENFQKGVNDVFTAAGKSVTDFVGDENTPGSLAGELDEMGRYAEEAGRKAQEMGEAYEKAFQTAVKAIADKITEYGSWIEKWNAKTGEIGTALDKLIGKYQELQQAILDANSVPTPEVPVIPETPKTPAGNTNTGGGTNTSGNTNGTTNTSKSTDTDTKTQTKDTQKQSQYQTSVSTDAVKAMQVYLGVTADGLWGPKSSAAAQKYLNSTADTAEEAMQYFRFMKAYARPDQANSRSDSIGTKAVLASSIDNKSFKDLGVSTGRISAVNTGWITYFPTVIKPSDTDTRYTFDTGGYTGEWDSSGRLAWLHQKELVLNASDTKNFLAATNIIRGITKTIDLQALSQSYRMAALQPASMQQIPQIVEQDIVIHADFPSVHERREIEAAFDTLLNRASQFANRKNK